MINEICAVESEQTKHLPGGLHLVRPVITEGMSTDRERRPSVYLTRTYRQVLGGS